MADESILQWIILLLLVCYLLVGLVVAGRRFARRSQRAYAQTEPGFSLFLMEALLWPATLVIDRSSW